MAEKRESNNLYVKVNVDCTEALTGLKAVAREAKKATAALKELEEQQSKVNDLPITTIAKNLDFRNKARSTVR
jgi:hypothetical protein